MNSEQWKHWFEVIRIIAIVESLIQIEPKI